MPTTEAAPRTITELLAAEHRRIATLLAATGRLVATDRLADATASLAELRAAHLRHAIMEEQHLLPIARERLGRAGDLESEHREIEHLLDELKITLEDADVSAFRHVRGELGELIAEHHAKEEQTFAARLDAALSAREREDLARRAHASLAV